jgi:hypothetical protein
MDDLAGRLKGCNIFTKLDLKQGYHQIPMAAADVKKTAFGLFEFVRMLFGLRNAGQSFQRMMDQILAGPLHLLLHRRHLGGIAGPRFASAASSTGAGAATRGGPGSQH